MCALEKQKSVQENKIIKFPAPVYNNVTANQYNFYAVCTIQKVGFFCTHWIIIFCTNNFHLVKRSFTYKR